MIKERIELPISARYVNHWMVHEALREIYQNAIDQETILGEDMLSDYNEETQTLTVGNKNTILEKKTLVLGNSAKASDTTQIGAFGEGYKLALVVLLRNELSITIKNNTEIWIPTLEYSSKFETDILVITIEENEEAFEKELLFIVQGLRPKVYNSYTQYNLRLQKNTKIEEVSQGQILLDSRNQGKVFISGLFVCVADENYKYGYNFKPGAIPVDRDRMKLDSFDLLILTNSVIKEQSEDTENMTRTKELIKLGSTEARYYSNSSYDSHPTSSIIASDLYKEFKEEHPNSTPVRSQEELREVEENYEGVKGHIVSDTLYDLYVTTEEYEEDFNEYEAKEEKLTPYEELIEFMNSYGDLFTQSLKIKFGNELMEKAKNWENK